MRQFRTIIAITGFLIAGVDHNGYHLYDIGVDGSVVKRDDYTTDGSGMMFATGVFETLYHKDIKVNEGMSVAVKAINAAYPA